MDVLAELYALEDHIALVEQQVTDLSRQERILLEAKLHAEKFHPDDPDWHDAWLEYDRKVDLLIPRTVAMPLLMATYAVYESVVLELAGKAMFGRATRKSPKEGGSRGFLSQASDFYMRRHNLKLFQDNDEKDKIEMLVCLRNAMAHANGRLSAVKKTNRDKILKWACQNIGISILNGYIVADIDFLKSMQQTVSKQLHRLIDWHLLQKPKVADS